MHSVKEHIEDCVLILQAQGKVSRHPHGMPIIVIGFNAECDMRPRTFLA